MHFVKPRILEELNWLSQAAYIFFFHALTIPTQYMIHKANVTIATIPAKIPVQLTSRVMAFPIAIAILIVALPYPRFASFFLNLSAG